MFAGHFGLAAAVKAREPKTPLWALMLGTQLLDVLFVPLLLIGIEPMVTIGDGGYGATVIHADYTHSLLGAMVIALFAAAVSLKLWGKRSAMVMGALVFSHWLLDLLVHRNDLPILPGNFGYLPLLGFGMWKWPVLSISLEILMITAGAVMYYRSLRVRARQASNADTAAKLKGRAFWTGLVTAMMLALSLLSDLLGIG